MIALARYNPDGTLDETFGVVPPSFSINDVSVTEGNSGTVNAVFTVTRSGDVSRAVAVDYATANGTAVAPGDYLAIPTTLLSFAAGQTSRTVTVVVNGDTLKEANETFFVNLTNATGGAVISDNQGVGTIVNDDGKPRSSSMAAMPAATTEYVAVATAGTSEQTTSPTLAPAVQETDTELNTTDLTLVFSSDSGTARTNEPSADRDRDRLQLRKRDRAVDLAIQDLEADLVTDQIASVLVP